MKPYPESPLHSVPSQSNTATRGWISRTCFSNSFADHLGTSICAGVNRFSQSFANRFTFYFPPNEEVLHVKAGLTSTVVSDQA